MSSIGIAVVGKTLSDIALEARKARAKLTVPDGRFALPMEWFLEKRVRPILSVEPDIREDNDSEMIGVQAAFDVGARILKVRESVVRGCKLQCADAMFTIAHEIGHVWLHSDRTYFRQNDPGKLPQKYCDPEWQADMFAVEFLADATILQNASDQMASLLRSGIPRQQALIYLAEYRSGQIKDQKEQRLDQYLKGVIQDGFDF